MDLNGCSTKGPQKVARENLTQNTFPPFSLRGGGQDGTKKQQLFELCPKCKVCLYIRIGMFAFFVHMFLVVVNFCSRHDHIHGFQLWRGKGGGSAFQPWGDGP